MLQLVLNNFKSEMVQVSFFNSCFCSLLNFLVEQQFSNFNLHDKECHGTCYHCYSQGPSQRFCLHRSEKDWGFPNDSDIGDVSKTI